MVNRFLKTLVFWNQEKSSITLASFIKIQNGGLQFAIFRDQLTWNNPSAKFKFFFFFSVLDKCNIFYLIFLQCRKTS